MQKHQEFRSSIFNLILARDQKEKRFFFELSMGNIYAPQDPAKVLEVIRRARLAAEDDFTGEHIDLLKLVARRDEIGNDRVHWHNRYYVMAGLNPDSWITLEQWLLDHDQDVNSVFLDDDYSSVFRKKTV